MPAVNRIIKILSVNEHDNAEFHKKSLQNFFSSNPEIKDREIVPISIFGAFKTGKSFLLGFFLRYLRAHYVKHDIKNWWADSDEAKNSFKWSNDASKSTTVGIDMWSEVFFHETNEGEKLAIVLMDTQGIHDLGCTSKNKMAVTAISTLLSSIQIFNIMHNIHQNHLEDLQLLSLFGKQISTAGKTSTSLFEKLIILVRDSKMIRNSFGFEGGEHLLEKRFYENEILTKESQQMSTDIRSAFSSIECFLMPYPGDIVHEDENFDGSVKHIRESFIEHLKVLIPRILGPDSIKEYRRLSGRLSKESFVEYLEKATDFLNNPDCLLPESLANAFLTAQTSAQFNKCLKKWKEYLLEFNEDWIQYTKNNQLLYERFRAIEKNILKEYDDALKHIDSKITKNNRELLEGHILTDFNSFKSDFERRRNNNKWKLYFGFTSCIEKQTN